MMKIWIYGMIYLGSALMVYNVYSYTGFMRRVSRKGDWGREWRLLRVPILLLVLFLIGYLAVGFFGKPDLVISGILFGGSIFVWIMLYLIRRIADRIQENEHLQAQLMAAEESSRAKTSFLSNMSHEIRTPMNAIIGLSNIALRDPELPPRTRRQLEKIDASARHLLSLINDILDMTRIESGRMTLKNEAFRFRDIVDQVGVMIGGQCAEKGLRYDCAIVGRVDDYYVGDDVKLRQVLINILGNSVKFTPAGGAVSLTIEQVDSSDDRRELRFVMKDTGIGMDKAYIPKLFEAFTQEDATATNRYGGSGLGMSITRSIVGMMDGDIHVDSEKGVGSTFTVTVRLGASDRQDADVSGVTLPENMLALVVDGNPVDREHARLVLEELGVKAVACATGAEALEAAKSDCHCMLVLTERRLRDMEGAALARTLKDRKDVTVVALLLSNVDGEDAMADVGSEVLDGVLSKPLFTDVLMRALQSQMIRRGGCPVQTPERAPEARLEGRRVLVAEDVEINAQILIHLLELEGIRTDRAENGKQALEMFEQSPPGHYDAVLMDMRMPVMDGLTASREIRALDRPDAQTVAIIAMTANAFEEDVRQSMEAGLNAHLTKPVEPGLLYETLRSAFS